MNRKCIVLLITQVFFAHVAFGQKNTYGLKVGGGFSFLQTELKSNPPQILTERFFPRPTGIFGIYYEQKVGKNISFGSKAHLNPIYSKAYLMLPDTDGSGNLNGYYSESYIYRDIYLIGLPLYFAYHRPNYGVSLGLQPNFLITSNGRECGKAVTNMGNFDWNNSYDELYVDRISYGAYASFQVNSFGRSKIEIDYFFGLDNILRGRSLSDFMIWRIQYLMIGLSHPLSPNKEN